MSSPCFRPFPLENEMVGTQNNSRLYIVYICPHHVMKAVGATVHFQELKHLEIIRLLYFLTCILERTTILSIQVQLSVGL